MRTLALAAAALVASASAALAAPAGISVTLDPKLQEKAEKTYGVKEVARLQDELQKDVARELARTGAYDGARIELVLVDVVPNRPTFKQLTDTPGLSMQSFGIGGAKIGGQTVAADGTVTPVDYRWYETDIRWSWANWTWSDAEYAFDRFARKLAQGPAVARR
jgi:hypothetical protein